MKKGFWEDVNVANCLLKSADISPLDTRDSLKRERFHPFTPGQHLEYRIPPNQQDWYRTDLHCVLLSLFIRLFCLLLCFIVYCLLFIIGAMIMLK